MSSNGTKCTETETTKEAVLSLVKYNGLLLRDLSLEWQSDEDIVLAAVQQNGYALEICCRSTTMQS